MADGSGSFRQVLLDLTGTTVNVHLLTTAVTYTGVEIVAVGSDFIVLNNGGVAVYVPIAAIASVELA